MIVDLTKLHPVDDAEMLFISPVIQDWSIVTSYGIDTVLDMEGGLDECIPTAPNGCLYVYFPIYDEDLPNLDKLGAVASLGAHLIENGHRVLSHCGMGFNRSALVAGRHPAQARDERAGDRRPHSGATAGSAIQYGVCGALAVVGITPHPPAAPSPLTEGRRLLNVTMREIQYPSPRLRGEGAAGG